jgi:hypothetical protein
VLDSVSYRLTLFLSRFIFSTLKMEATRSSETPVHNKPTRRHIPEDGILHLLCQRPNQQIIISHNRMQTIKMSMRDYCCLLYFWKQYCSYHFANIVHISLKRKTMKFNHLLQYIISMIYILSVFSCFGCVYTMFCSGAIELFFIQAHCLYVLYLWTLLFFSCFIHGGLILFVVSN